MDMMDISKYKCKGQERLTIDTNFSLVISVPELNRKTFIHIPEKSGVYLLTVVIDGIEYKVYVGESKNLNQRLNQYTMKFQPTSPSDYKLLFFQELLFEKFEGSDIEFKIYIRVTEYYKAEEMEFIKDYNPWINGCSLTDNLYDKIKLMYRSFYQMMFLNKL